MRFSPCFLPGRRCCFGKLGVESPRLARYNNFVQATPGYANLLFLSQVPGAPDDNRSPRCHRMSNSLKPWSNHRQVLWAVGALGLLLSAFGLFLAWFLQGGFGPGRHTSPPGLIDLCATLLLSIPYVYYIVVAHRAWTRKLWVIGVAIHSLLLIGVVATLLQHRGGSLVAPPLLLIGPVTWMLYAKRNTFSEHSG
jgi:hypothetical protein